MAGADRFTSITNSTLYDKLSFNFIEGRHRCSCRPPKRKSPLEWGFFGMEPNQKICGTGCHLGRTRKYNRIGDAGVPVLSHSPSVLENGTGENR